MKPVVDRLESEMGDRLKVIRVNVQDSTADGLLKAYGFQYTPTFILFGPDGNVLWRQVGGLDVARVRESTK
jgi:thiol-disulfide isomerase/thioredoxin